MIEFKEITPAIIDINKNGHFMDSLWHDEEWTFGVGELTPYELRQIADKLESLNANNN